MMLPFYIVNPRFFTNEQVALWVEEEGFLRYYESFIRSGLNGDAMMVGFAALIQYLERINL